MAELAKQQPLSRGAAMRQNFHDGPMVQPRLDDGATCTTCIPRKGRTAGR